MNNRCGSLLLVLASFAIASTAPAQVQYSPAYSPSPGPLPLMYVRFAGPPGTKVTIYRNTKGATFEAPFTVGLRPGYIYRMQVDNIPNHPGITLFPTLDVRGSLQLHMRTRNADFPANIWFHEDDLTAFRNGSLVTKVIVLEHPDQAIAAPSTAEQPLEVAVSAQRDPVEEAGLRGQPLVIMHLGKRQFTPQELGAQAIAGTVLLPGERVLGVPAQPPRLPGRCYPLIDPLNGPKDMTGAVLLYDGGDSGQLAGYSRGRLKGVDPTDTVAEYVDSRGNKRVVASNRVGILVPRFVVLRGETALARNSMPVVLAAKNALHSRDIVRTLQPAETYHQFQHLDVVKGRERVSGNVHITGITLLGRVDGLQRFVTLNPGTTSVTAITPGAVAGQQPQPDRPLKIDKWPDKLIAQIGDVVLFTIRYTNQGGSEIRDIVLHEDLATRFEYIPGSAKTEREANFTSQPNDVGSHRLQWEIPGVLAPGESGTVTFEVRIR